MPEIVVLSKLGQKSFSELLDVCFQLLSGKLQSSQPANLLKRVSESAGVELSDLEPVVKSVLKVLKDAVKFHKASSSVQEELRNIGLNDEQIEVFKAKWDKEHSSLAQSTVDAATDVNPLVDVEWKFGVTSSSSEMNTVGNVFLQLKMEIDKGNAKTDSVCFELQLPEFYSFLHELERARATLDYLS